MNKLDLILYKKDEFFKEHGFPPNIILLGQYDYFDVKEEFSDLTEYDIMNTTKELSKLDGMQFQIIPDTDDNVRVGYVE